MGPVNTVRLVRGKFARSPKKSTLSLTVMLGSDMIMFSNTRVYPCFGSAWWGSEKYRSSVFVRTGMRASTLASSSSGHLSHCFLV